MFKAVLKLDKRVAASPLFKCFIKNMTALSSNKLGYRKLGLFLVACDFELYRAVSMMYGIKRARQTGNVGMGAD